jgi:phosphatidylserine decarboxylase
MVGKIAPFPGHSAHEKPQIEAFLREVSEEVRDFRISADDCAAPVRALDELLRRDPITRMYAQEMLEQVPAPLRVVSDIPALLTALQLLSTRAPAFHADPQRANFFPASALFVHMMMTPAGQALFRLQRFNDCLRAILKGWCLYLDSPPSRTVLHTDEGGWLSASSWARHHLEEYRIPDGAAPHWGFASFNAFFHRQIKRECRPVAEPSNPKIIVSPNDGTLYKVEREVKGTDRFWVKSQPYSLEHMLAGDPLFQRFLGGTVYQSFLDGRNYHRFWSPIAGSVHKIVHIEGLMFSSVAAVGTDLTAGTYSQAYMSCVNTRTMVFLDSDDPAIGMVCLIAVGISEVSSISLSVRSGQHLGKGDEIGRFSYGGSSICLLFQPGVIREFVVDVRESGTEVGTRGATLKAGQSIAFC